jgi:hypothetical protein
MPHLMLIAVVAGTVQMAVARLDGGFHTLRHLTRFRLGI